MRKKREFFTTNKLGFDDSDSISRPHGFLHPDEVIAEEIQKLTKEVRKNQRKQKGIDIDEKNDIHTAEQQKPFLPDRGKKNYKHRMLQDLFIERDEAPFDLIAMRIGLNKTLRSYHRKQRNTIIRLQKRFNVKSKKPWGMILSSTRGVPFDGLKLIRTNQKKI